MLQWRSYCNINISNQYVVHLKLMHNVICKCTSVFKKKKMSFGRGKEKTISRQKHTESIAVTHTKGD